MSRNRVLAALSGALLLGSAGVANAQSGSAWYSGDWSLTIGAAGSVSPEYEGAKDYLFRATPMISFGRTGTITRFSSRNDNISFAVYDNETVRVGVAGKFIFRRDDGDSDDLRGLDPVRFGGELGGFVEVYATDWLRIRGEVRHGIRSHKGVVADVSADAFQDVTPTIRISGGPRISFASADYFDAYYGVNSAESAASGLGQYSPGGGVRSAGVGGAVTWKTTDKVTTSLFGEYSRLMGPAKDSTLVRERGSPDQFTVGVSATYRFDFRL
ncbi:MipA/OmpV family protein [Mesorhizobium sp. SB112]|uniref:MipA/OmpV family protein n=1 Tax=Mesorhizobium sp. SB112 TaxID=3151853 RepID=UPI003265DBE3